jgi:hypothetical protein
LTSVITGRAQLDEVLLVVTLMSLLNYRLILMI